MYKKEDMAALAILTRHYKIPLDLCEEIKKYLYISRYVWQDGSRTWSVSYSSIISNFDFVTYELLMLYDLYDITFINIIFDDDSFIIYDEIISEFMSYLGLGVDKVSFQLL